MTSVQTYLFLSDVILTLYHHHQHQLTSSQIIPIRILIRHMFTSLSSFLLHHTDDILLPPSHIRTSILSILTRILCLSTPITITPTPISTPTSTTHTISRTEWPDLMDMLFTMILHETTSRITCERTYEFIRIQHLHGICMEDKGSIQRKRDIEKQSCMHTSTYLRTLVQYLLAMLRYQMHTSTTSTSTSSYGLDHTISTLLILPSMTKTARTTASTIWSQLIAMETKLRAGVRRIALSRTDPHWYDQSHLDTIPLEEPDDTSNLLSTVTLNDIQSHDLLDLLSLIDVHDESVWMKWIRYQDVVTNMNETSMEQHVGTEASLSVALVPNRMARLELLDHMLHATSMSSKDSDKYIPLIALDRGQSLDESSSHTHDTRSPLWMQLVQQLNGVHPSRLRTRVGMYAWKTKLIGVADQGAQGWPGPFSKAISSISTVLVKSALSGEGQGTGGKPLLILSPNGAHQTGLNRDALIINPALTSPADLAQYYVLGQLMGISIRSSTALDIDLSSTFWSLLQHGSESMLSHGLHHALHVLATFDAQAARALQFTQPETGIPYDADEFALLDLYWTVTLSDGRTVIELIPHGRITRVIYDQRYEYALAAVRARLNESAVQLNAIRVGIHAICPPLEISSGVPPPLLTSHPTPQPNVPPSIISSTSGLLSSSPINYNPYLLPTHIPPIFTTLGSHLSLLTSSELESRICGQQGVDLEFLKKHTTYRPKHYNADSPIIKDFWAVLESFSPADRSRFLQFCWARSRLPLDMSREKMKINVVEGTTQQAADGRMPTAQTCFCLIDLPKYSSRQIMHDRLKHAILCSFINF